MRESRGKRRKDIISDCKHKKTENIPSFGLLSEVVCVVKPFQSSYCPAAPLTPGTPHHTAEIAGTTIPQFRALIYWLFTTGSTNMEN